MGDLKVIKPAVSALFRIFAVLQKRGKNYVLKHMGPTGFDSEINRVVSTSSYGINARKYLFQTFKWRK